MMISLTQIVENLKKPLPGWNGQKHLAPNFRAEEIEKIGSEINNAKKSAVLILIYEKNNELHIPFIKRPAYDGIHSGQISFPGGKSEATDIDFQHTALRETYEEIGIEPTFIDVKAQLSDLYIPPSNYLVKVFVGTTKEHLMFKADPKEVAEIIEIPIKEFFKPDIIKEKIFYRSVDGQEKKAPYFDLQGVEIWGATAMIISELLSIIRE
jgi:8-oxo-dGTP pyrophosphatase MutT (NUDIX family)